MLKFIPKTELETNFNGKNLFRSAPGNLAKSRKFYWLSVCGVIVSNVT